MFDFRKPEAALSNCRSSPFGSQKQPFHKLKATLSEAKKASMKKGIDEDHPSPTITNSNARASPEAFPSSGGVRGGTCRHAKARAARAIGWPWLRSAALDRGRAGSHDGTRGFLAGIEASGFTPYNGFSAPKNLYFGQGTSSGDFLRVGRALPHGQTGSCVGSSSNKRSADSISSSSNHVLNFAFALTFTSSDTWPQIFLST